MYVWNCRAVVDVTHKITSATYDYGESISVNAHLQKIYYLSNMFM